MIFVLPAGLLILCIVWRKGIFNYLGTQKELPKYFIPFIFTTCYLLFVAGIFKTDNVPNHNVDPNRENGLRRAISDMFSAVSDELDEIIWDFNVSTIAAFSLILFLYKYEDAKNVTPEIKVGIKTSRVLLLLIVLTLILFPFLGAGM